jgi:DNA-binding NarL/FixJ family response regulator
MRTEANLDRHWNRWTTREMRILEVRYNDGIPDEQIAKELGRTLWGIKNQRFKMNLKSGSYQRPRMVDQVSNGLTEQKKNKHHKPWTREEMKILKVRVNDGVPVDQIAEELGRTVEAIRTRFRRLNLFMNNHRPETTSQIEHKLTQPREKQTRKIQRGQVKEVSILWGLFKFTKS